MARGQVLTIPNQTSQLIESLSHEEIDSVAVLNPNDGVVYLKLNGPAGSSNSQWDWKLPSQSYGLFPGPWISLGLYYLDQSGSGRTAELNVYDSSDKLYTPYIVAIGRAVQSAGTTVDISQGTQPQNPPASTGRLWIDGSGHLHVLQSNGTDYTTVDSNNVAGYVQPLINATALGGDLTGTVANGHINIQTGSRINMVGGAYIEPYPGDATYVHISQLTVTPGTTALAGLSVNGSENVTSNLTVGGQAVITGLFSGSGGGYFHNDLTVDRGSALGYVWLGNSGQRYLGFDGSRYYMPTSPLVIDSNFQCGGYAALGNSLYMPFGNYVIWNNSGATAIYCDANQMQFAHTTQWTWNKVGSTSLTSVISQFTNGGWAYVFNSYLGTAAGNALCVAGNNLQGQAFYVNGGAGGAGGWNVISDKKLKSNLIPLDNALSLVMDPRVHSYHYTATPPAVLNLETGAVEYQAPMYDAYGFVADEWHLVAPDVTTPTPDNFLMMEYGQVTAILFQAFKDYVVKTDERLDHLERHNVPQHPPGPPGTIYAV